MLSLRMERKIVKASKNYLVKSNRLAPLYYLNRKVYRVMERIIKNQLSVVPGIVAIYLSHGLQKWYITHDFIHGLKVRFILPDYSEVWLEKPHESQN